MTRLPVRFAKHAASIATMNPVAFKSVADAEAALARCYGHIQRGKETTGVSTGGFYFTKDGEGEIDLWVSPDMVWAKSDG